MSNEKAKAVDVRLVQPFDGGWKLLDASTKGTKTDAQTTQWTLHVPAGGTTKLHYSVLMGP